MAGLPSGTVTFLFSDVDGSTKLVKRLSVGLHSGEAGVGWVGPAVNRCMELCDAAEGGQIVLSGTTASLLEDEDLGGLSVRDLGDLRTRRIGTAVRIYELA